MIRVIIIIMNAIVWLLVIKDLLNNECKEKPSLPNRYTFIENKYLIDVIEILESNNIEIKTIIFLFCMNRAVLYKPYSIW